MSNLKKDIDKIFKNFVSRMFDEWQGKQGGEPLVIDKWIASDKEATTQIINLIESVVNEIIGKDEIEQAQSVYDKEVEQTFEIPDTLTQERNQLRKEQRDIKSKLIDGSKDE